MLTLAICDDETYFLESLQSGVRGYLEKRELGNASIATFSSGEELLEAGRDFDIVLMDMKLPGKSGLEVVEQLRSEKKRCQIIFTTSYQEYAVQAFDLDAVHYLLKPVSEDKLFHALDKALKGAEDSSCRTLAISKGSCTQRVPIRDILYCEAMDHKIYIHTVSGDCDYFGTLDALQEKLDDSFFRCHRSYIVNLNFVISKDRDTAAVSGGDRVLVSRRKQQEFTQRLLEFFRNEVL